MKTGQKENEDNQWIVFINGLMYVPCLGDGKHTQAEKHYRFNAFEWCICQSHVNGRVVR
jgi:hypothetical protein